VLKISKKITVLGCQAFNFWLKEGEEGTLKAQQIRVSGDLF
jgi:hypothetical protein